MAAVVAKPAGTATKMKKPPPPILQTNVNGTRHPSASPSSARKTLPGQTQTPSSATSNSANVNGASRPNRRLQRINTRNNAADGTGADKKAARRPIEPHVLTAHHILKKFRGRPPSLIVHLHPTNFRFDQQEGSFSYQSEMRIFIEHLAKGTIPHDMVEEFRKSDVQYYDGWLIVRVIDHKNVAKSAEAAGQAEDDEPFSIHNYNEAITPSPYGKYIGKEKKPPAKQEAPGETKEGLNSDDTVDALPKSTNPMPRVYHVALEPTNLSRHVDLTLDAMAPDPKSLNRKSSQMNVNSRAGQTTPQTPISGMPPTPSAEKGPPLKKPKLRIDPKDMLEYEARIVNATAPPLFLDIVENFEEAVHVIEQLRDPAHDARPPSPKSRKRTVAELAADDAHAKEQERFMLIMDERIGVNTAANAGAVESQAGAALFQPRFEKFNALDNIKREIAERKQREKDRQIQEDENRRGQQERMQEEEKKRIIMQRAQEARMLRARQQQEALAAQAAQAQAQSQGQIPRPPPQQVNGIPPNMQNQMMAANAQRGSPIVRQGTPHGASSPVITSGVQSGHAMAVSASQQGAGSPARPNSAVQHGHPAQPMTRQPSGQGPSRNGTPQIPHGTPAGRNATPILRQGTPAQHITQASPHGSMVAPTPQMAQAAMMAGQMPNGMPRQLNPQQAAELQRRQALQQQQQAAAQAMQMNGTPHMTPAQMAHLQAQQHAQADRQAALQRQQQAQQAAMQQGTPQSAHMSPVAPTAQKVYNAQVAEQMKAQMANLQHNSPHLTPQQQAAQMHQQQQVQQRMFAQAQAAQNQMAMGQHPQQRQPLNPQLQALYQTTLQAYTNRFLQQAAAKYQGNTSMLQPAEVAEVQRQAKASAMASVQRKKQEQQQLSMQQAQQMRQQMGMQNNMNMQNMQNVQNMQNMQNMGMGMQNMGNMQMPNGNVNPNMAAAIQQQQAQQMQQMQMANAQMMMQAHQQQQQNMGFQGR